MALHLLNKLTRIEGGSMKSVITRERMNAIQDILAALWRGENITTTGSLTRTPGLAGVRLDGRAVSDWKRGGGGGPFDVTLKSEGVGEAVTYAICVADGWINERIPGVQVYPTNATPCYKPTNILWGSDGAAMEPPRAATDRREFPITIGQQVSVVVYVKATSEVGPPDAEDPVDPDMPTEPTEIVVEQEWEEGGEGEEGRSTYYIPPCADDAEGAAGEFHYKLAVLRDADAQHVGPWLELFLAGSHVDHHGVFLHENASNPAPGGSGRVLEKYDEETNQYIYRLIQQGGKLKVTELPGGGAIEIRGNEIVNLVRFMDEGGSEGAAQVLNWDDGLMMSDVADGLTVLIPVVVGGAGVVVGLSPGTTRTYVVSIETEYVDGSLTITKEGSSEQVKVEWVNGLVRTAAHLTIEIPERGAGLPEGLAGEMLYCLGGANWALLANPGVPGTGDEWMLSHNGTTPVWVKKTLVDLAYCEDGVTRTGEFMKTFVAPP